MFKESLSAALALLIAASAAEAASCGKSAKGFDGFLNEIRAEAKGLGIARRGIAALDDVVYDPAIIKRDRAQSVFSQSFLEFQARMVSDYRIKQGAVLYKKHRAIFEAVENEYGVPGPVIIAFWALETDFGANIGDLPTIQSLATLAWDCRRPEKFRPQLLAALDLVGKGDLAASEMRGAWAGEIGQTQFLPKEYDETAVDFDGDGRRDLRRSIPDVMASSAALLVKHGWQANQPWLQEVRVPRDMAWEEADIAIQHPRAQWVKWGVKGVGKDIKADKFQASLLLPMGRNGPAFLAYDNFTTAYLKWNESLVYSTTAAYLATRIAGAPRLNPGNGKVTPLAFKEIIEMQKLLVRRGHDVGDVDGKIGAATRAAVKDVQLKMGWPADSYPDAAFLDALRGG
ncbi:MAG: lytic murein transglycosylase [Alphaproteobacteria bacterium]|nr:lytic murein transglycosylase [Alphaproteobacteria bacterium]